jgi:hypothetical protein
MLFRIHIHFLPKYFFRFCLHLFADDLALLLKGALEKFRQISVSLISIRRRLFCGFAIPYFIWFFTTWFYFTENKPEEIEHITYGAKVTAQMSEPAVFDQNVVES